MARCPATSYSNFKHRFPLTIFPQEIENGILGFYQVTAFSILLSNTDGFIVSVIDTFKHSTSLPYSTCMAGYNHGMNIDLLTLPTCCPQKRSHQRRQATGR